MLECCKLVALRIGARSKEQAAQHGVRVTKFFAMGRFGHGRSNTAAVASPDPPVTRRVGHFQSAYAEAGNQRPQALCIRLRCSRGTSFRVEPARVSGELSTARAFSENTLRS